MITQCVFCITASIYSILAQSKAPFLGCLLLVRPASIMKRAAIERLRTLRVWRRHLANHDHEVACRCEFQPGRFRKGQRAGGCGSARCWLCHYDKLSKLATLQECRASAIFYEGLLEMGRFDTSLPRVRITARR
jgi:hypothetical protein